MERAFDTAVLTVDPEQIQPEVIRRAAEIIKNGQLVAFPTETVYGLGADGFQQRAVEDIYAVKGRPGDNPLIFHIASLGQVEDLAACFDESAQLLARRFWPGPLTMVLPRKKNIPAFMTRGLDTIAVRFPGNPIARALVEAAGTCIAAPSANSSGRPSPTRAAHVLADLNGKIPLILDGGPTRTGLDSTVIDLSVEAPCLLRPGAITREMLEEALGEVCLPTGAAERPKSPGMKYKHYAPLADVKIVRGEEKQAAAAIRRMAEASPHRTGIMATDETRFLYDADRPGCVVLSLGSRGMPVTIAASLYDTLRRFDELGVREVFAEAVPETGIGAAIMNRLTKAAGGQIVDV